MADYWELREKANKLFLKWWKCEDKKLSLMLWREYLKALHEASKVAPPPDEIFR
jgi:hypothetical protein